MKYDLFLFCTIWLVTKKNHNFQLTYKNRSGQTVPFRDPVLVETTNGIGEKLKISVQTGQYESIGLDLVAMCVNDILCFGAQPIAFLDYIACGKLIVPVVAQIIKGIADGCRESGCALLGKRFFKFY